MTNSSPIDQKFIDSLKEKSFNGSTQNNTRHGQGQIDYDNGISFTGMFKNGVPNGYGVYRMPDGSIFKG